MRLRNILGVLAIGAVFGIAGCGGGGGGGTTTPATKAVVTIAINKSISKLDSLKLKVTNTDGATFTNAVTLNEALASNAFMEAGIAIGDPSNLVSVGLASANGFDVAANSPIVQLNYTVSSGAPTFTVSSVPSSSTFNIVTQQSEQIILNPADFVVKVTYQ